MTENLIDDARELLERWAEWADRHVHRDHRTPPLSGYGPGYRHWGVQSNWNYLAAMATLAATPGVRARQRWHARAVEALRLALATHVTGDRTCGDGGQWGHSWIGMLGIERAMHGVHHLDEAMEPSDRQALHRVLVAEADWLLHDGSRGRFAGVVGGKWAADGKNNPESNIWSGALLWRVACMYPDEPNASAWRELAHDYLVNGVSVERDVNDATDVAGRPLSERYRGANFFPNYALDHHGYLNVGYMVICASNAAILHFDTKKTRVERPESLDHHQRDLWNVLKRMVFADGRLARIGGDSRVRYAYCQEYLFPALLYAADRFGDEHALDLVERQLVLVRREADANGDGSFYGTRVASLRDGNPHYFTRLESDRAVALAMVINYLPLVDAPPAPPVPFDEAVAGDWFEEEHGAVMTRSTRRFASFSWRARELGQGLCLPPADGSLAEWSRNLCPVVRFLGDTDRSGTAHRRLLHSTVTTTTGGFVTCGEIMEGVDVSIDEGARCTDQAVTQLAFAVLPDDRTSVVFQRVVCATDRIGYVTEVKGLHMNIPNDVFNTGVRTISSAAGTAILETRTPRDELVEVPGRWVNVDGVLGVVLIRGDDGLCIDRSASPRGGTYSSLRVDELCSGVHHGVRRVDPGEVLVDLCCALLVGADAAETAALETETAAWDACGVRAVQVRGADGTEYLVAANFGTEPAQISVDGSIAAVPARSAVMEAVVYYRQ
ncbi:MAG: hypothetical protein EA382_18370 [Spirochaetaceae bacterium]|nr:MAG: hypothetical protein EA382_18370 [Spirochaetaceae bacterium]